MYGNLLAEKRRLDSWERVSGLGRMSGRASFNTGRVDIPVDSDGVWG